MHCKQAFTYIKWFGYMQRPLCSGENKTRNTLAIRSPEMVRVRARMMRHDDRAPIFPDGLRPGTQPAVCSDPDRDYHEKTEDNGGLVG